MDVSLVVCTRNRARQLRASLERVGRIESRRRWELVLVDNGSTDHTSDVIDDFASSATFPVHRELEPAQGLNRARNRGCGAARGVVVAITDDDCYPEPDYVDAVWDVFATYDVGWAGGRMTLHDPDDAAVSLVDRDEVELLPPHHFPYPGFIGGGNLAFRRELFHDIGGFDEALGVGADFPCGDIEFCARASDRGWAGGFFPGPTVRHHHGRRPGEEAEEIRRTYRHGRGAYYAKTLLELSTLRIPCLKYIYWQTRDRGLSGAGHELAGAARYLARRASRSYSRKRG